MYFMLLGSILEFVYVGLSLENKRRVVFWATPITTCIYILYILCYPRVVNVDKIK